MIPNIKHSITIMTQTMTQTQNVMFAEGASASVVYWSTLGGIIVVTLLLWFLWKFLNTLRNVKLSSTVLDLSGMEYMCWHIKRLFCPSLDRLGGLEGDSCLWCRFILFVHKLFSGSNDQADPRRANDANCNTDAIEALGRAPCSAFLV